jgi:CheY-like chemotaxis protein
LGYETDVAEDGEAVLAAVAANRYDLILMDLQMPKMDGLQATAAIRQRETEEGGRVPIVAVTASRIEGNRERCLAAGMDDCVTKPFRASELDIAIKRNLALEPSAPSFEPTTPVSNAVFDRQEALARMRGDHAHLHRMIALFLQDTPAQLAQISAGCAARDLASVARQAHSLKGAGAMLSAYAFRSAAERLELAAKGGNVAESDGVFKMLETEFQRVKAELPSLPSAA